MKYSQVCRFEDDIGRDDTGSFPKYTRKPFRKPFPASAMYDEKIYVYGGYITTVTDII